MDKLGITKIIVDTKLNNEDIGTCCSQMSFQKIYKYPFRCELSIILSSCPNEFKFLPFIAFSAEKDMTVILV